MTEYCCDKYYEVDEKAEDSKKIYQRNLLQLQEIGDFSEKVTLT